jgi:hypothetical protein
MKMRRESETLEKGKQKRRSQKETRKRCSTSIKISIPEKQELTQGE